MPMIPVEVIPHWDHFQLIPHYSDSKAHVRDFQMRLDRAMCSSMAAALDPHQTYPLPLQNDGISRSQLLIDRDPSAQVAVKMTHQKDLPLEDRRGSLWTCDKEYPTSMLCLWKGSFEASGAGLNMD